MSWIRDAVPPPPPPPPSSVEPRARTRTIRTDALCVVVGYRRRTQRVYPRTHAHSFYRVDYTKTAPRRRRVQCYRRTVYWKIFSFFFNSTIIILCLTSVREWVHIIIIILYIITCCEITLDFSHGAKSRVMYTDYVLRRPEMINRVDSWTRRTTVKPTSCTRSCRLFKISSSNVLFAIRLADKTLS